MVVIASLPGYLLTCAKEPDMELISHLLICCSTVTPTAQADRNFFEPMAASVRMVNTSMKSDLRPIAKARESKSTLYRTLCIGLIS